MHKILSSLTVLFLFAMCSSPDKTAAPAIEKHTNKVVLSSDIKWEQLNPARGDKSPLAGTVWGDRKGTVATGFLAKFVDGFSSPPHIHNVTYRAMVINGLIHNDDENAEKMWMPAGSFWTQPAGAPHITAAKGDNNLIYVEIDSGPYLVNPIEQAHDNGERPVNIDASNIVWLDASQTSLIKNEHSTTSPELAFLWDDGKMSGKLLKLPAHFDGQITSNGDEFHAIIIDGNPNYSMPDGSKDYSLDPGSYFTSTGNSVHSLSCKGNSSTIYIRTNGTISITSGK